MINEITQKLLKFRKDRQWEQYHSPENLVKSISIEANELLEQYQWKDPDNLLQVRHEIADLVIYLLYLCHDLDIDLIEVVNEKININSYKYPINKSRGKCTKYDKL